MFRKPALCLFTLLGATLVALGAHAPAATAQDAGSLIIAVTNCPAGYTDDTYAADCTTPASGIDFTVGTPNTDNTETTTSRGDGLATFSLAPYDLDPSGPDRVSVGEPADPSSDYVVSCTKNGDESLDYTTETIDFQPGGSLRGISFAVDTGEDIGCNWYRIPQATSGSNTGDQVSQFPSTGVGAASGESTAPHGLLPMIFLLALAGAAAVVLRRSGTS